MDTVSTKQIILETNMAAVGDYMGWNTNETDGNFQTETTLQLMNTQKSIADCMQTKGHSSECMIS